MHDIFGPDDLPFRRQIWIHLIPSNCPPW